MIEMNKLKILQINTGRGKQATILFTQKVLKKLFDIIRIQEPYKGNQYQTEYKVYKNSNNAKTET